MLFPIWGPNQFQRPSPVYRANKDYEANRWTPLSLFLFFAASVVCSRKARAWSFQARLRSQPAALPGRRGAVADAAGSVADGGVARWTWTDESCHPGCTGDGNVRSPTSTLGNLGGQFNYLFGTKYYQAISS